MTFKEAAARQYGRATIYTAWLIRPDGARALALGTSARKTRQCLRDKAYGHGREILELIGVNGCDMRNGAGFVKLIAPDGVWRVAWGDTIRQEAMRP